MPVTVPTIEEFNALAGRVTVLEKGNGGNPGPEPPTDIPAITAKRVADVIELFGVNTFSSMDEHNVWGSWPADYRPSSVIPALQYMLGDSKFNFMIREYHYKGRESFQKPWFDQILAVFPATKIALCPGANAGADAVPSMVKLPGTYFEGLNEPNTDFGSGEVSKEQTAEIQDAVWRAVGRARHKDVMGPSIVAGTPRPEGWITGYAGDTLPKLNSEMAYGNGHFYPPGCPEVATTGYSTSEYVYGLSTAYAQHPIMLTEFHPTLYNSEGNKPDEPGWTGPRDAYYNIMTLFRCARDGGIGLWWYALFDYGTTYRCGLFPVNQDNPREAATAMRNLCNICADNGSDLRSFIPGDLPVRIMGTENWDLYQSSTGVFFVSLWKAAKDLGGASTNVTLELGRTPKRLEMFDVLSGQVTTLEPRPVNTIALYASCRVIRITF